MIRTQAKLAPFMLSREHAERLKHERDEFSISPPLRHSSGQASTMLRAGSTSSGRTAIFAFIRTIVFGGRILPPDAGKETIRRLAADRRDSLGLIRTGKAGRSGLFP
jgi:hypothetical protein